MACLLDTGILLRAFDASSSEYRQIRQDLRALVTRQERLVVALQNVAEFWNVSTRSIDKNGYGLSVERTDRRVQIIQRFCEVVSESNHSYRVWKDLLNVHSVTGVTVHDARLVSVMLSHGVSDIFTLNERDFRRYPGITILTPGSV
jgi:predicted nucleic acid-binding protein